jgi:hypothetical protein
VVAVSEKMLNDQLESYFWAEPKLQTMNANFVMVEIKNGKLLPSRVTIPINGEDRSSLIYTLRIKSATLTWPALPSMTDVVMAMSTGKKIEMKSEEIKDWNIPLTVDWGACAKQPHQNSWRFGN